MGSGHLNILIVENSIGFTGALRSIMAVTTYLTAHYDIAFTYLIPSGSDNQAVLEEAGFNVEKAPFIEIRKHPRTFLYPVRLFQNARLLKGLVKKYRIDLVHINDLYNLVGIAARKTGLPAPVIYHIRLLGGSYAGRLYKIWQGLLTSYADGLVAVSYAVASTWPEGRQDLQVIYDAIPQQYEELPPAAPGKPFRFIYLANYTRGKGQEYAISALSEAVKTNPDLHITFAGSDFGMEKNRQFRTELEDMAKNEGLEDKVSFSGPVKQIKKYFSQFDCLLNFSLSESFSMVNLEAMHLGLPVISTDSGGPGEILEDGKTGILVPVGNTGAMAGEMTRLAGDSSLWQTIRHQAFAGTQAHLSLSRSAGELDRFYRSFL
ncbi:MAG: glycosyltransferase family 4 protein [Cyclobacteriaceae bacterium]